MLQIISLLIGSVAGFYWEFVANHNYKTSPTLVNSLFIKVGNKDLHLHHWVIYLLLLVLTIFWGLNNDKIFHPAIIFICSFILSALVYGFVFLTGWSNFFK